jgi:AbrB family looped-hinge helix DNA binding protein
MNQSAQLTSKGQLTVPKGVRDRLKVTSGDRIEFVEDESGRIYLRAKTIRAADLAGILKKPGRKPATIEEMNEAVAAAAAERYERAVGRR